MLALTRKRGESIMIGNPSDGPVIEVVVLSVQNDQVKLGIIAPRSVPVHRKEIFEQIKTENVEALKGADKLTDLSKLRRIMKGN
jgi:carbon storage regulator